MAHFLKRIGIDSFNYKFSLKFSDAIPCLLLP